jgi:hypothetical protein
MKAVSEQIYQFFTSQTGFTDVMSTKLYPVVGNLEVGYPFAVYNITQQTGITKDADAFTVVISGYFEDNQYDDCAEFSDAMTVLLKNTRSYDWVTSEIGFVQENQSFVASIKFNIDK